MQPRRANRLVHFGVGRKPKIKMQSERRSEHLIKAADLRSAHFHNVPEYLGVEHSAQPKDHGTVSARAR